MQRQQAVQFNVPNGSVQNEPVTFQHFKRLSPWKVYACKVVTGTLFTPSCLLKHAVSASARKPLRIFLYMLSVSMNYVIPGCTGR